MNIQNFPKIHWYNLDKSSICFNDSQNSKKQSRVPRSNFAANFKKCNPSQRTQNNWKNDYANDRQRQKCIGSRKTHNHAI